MPPEDIERLVQEAAKGRAAENAAAERKEESGESGESRDSESEESTSSSSEGNKEQLERMETKIDETMNALAMLMEALSNAAGGPSPQGMPSGGAPQGMLPQGSPQGVPQSGGQGSGQGEQAETPQTPELPAGAAPEGQADMMRMIQSQGQG